MSPFHPMAIVHVVEDLEQAVAFARDVLLLPVLERGDGWVVMDNGSICVRLERGTPPAGAHRVCLELATRDLASSAASLLQHPDVSPLSPATWVSANRQEHRLRGPHGIELVLFREYTEDELGVTPALDKQLTWEADAERLMQALLRRVPLAFRDETRHRATRLAEYAAVCAGVARVDYRHVVRGLCRATPLEQREPIRRALLDAGVPGPVVAEECG